MWGEKSRTIERLKKLNDKHWTRMREWRDRFFEERKRADMYYSDYHRVLQENANLRKQLEVAAQLHYLEQRCKSKIYDIIISTKPQPDPALTYNAIASL
jgi:hypothetical protein